MQRHLLNILDGVDALVYVTDMETDKILFLNKKIKKAFNLGEEAIGNFCWRLIQSNSERCAFCPLFQLEKDPNTPVTWEERNPVTGKYYKNTDSVIKWDGGKAVHLHHAIDITATKEAQKDAADMLGILKNILNGMDAYVYVSDMETDEILFINNRMQEAFCLDERAVGKICWQVLQDGFTERCSFCPNFKLEKNPNIPVVWEEHNTVTKRHYKNVDSVIEWMGGKKVHMQHSSDITDMMEAQEETLAVRERLETALAASQAGVWELDFSTGLLTYDAMCAHLFRLDEEKKSISISKLAAHLEKMTEVVPESDLIRTLLGGDPYANSSSRDYRLVLPDGAERYVRNYGNTFRDDAGTALRVIGMSIDITPHVTMEKDLKAAKDAAENANHAKSQFLSNMSHEIRTPMNAILGMTEILLNENLNDRQRHHLEDIRVSATALLDIINDILDFSKIEAGKFELVQVDYDLANLLRNLEAIFSFAARKKNIEFRMDIRGDIPACLYGDDVRMRQVLVNVIGNAVKFTTLGGVTLTVAAGGGKLRFAVSDTGIGIKPENIPTIFSDFNRVDLRNTRTIAGTGLGLSITKSLVSMMNGSIRVESEYGKGTTFYIEFPLVAGNPANLVREQTEQAFISAPGAQVLVVDDNEVNLNVAAGLLRMFDIDCDTALSGPEAIRMIGAEHYDLVFMDHMMPGMDGVETTKILRKQYAPDALVIVALTANAVAGARESLLGARMNDYLSKPVEKMALSQMLCKWLPAGKVRQKDAQAPAPAEKRELSAPLARVSAIDGIDIRLGLDRGGGMQDAYETSLSILARRLPGSSARLAAFLEAGDMRAFAIEAHGLKGSLHNIGATAMALEAESLEHRAKENDTAFCRAGLPGMRASLSALHAELAAALATETAAPAAPGDKEALRRQLSLVRDMVDSFEGDDALAILRALREYDYGTELNGMLQELGRLIEEFAYDQAVSLLDSR